MTEDPLIPMTDHLPIDYYSDQYDYLIKFKLRYMSFLTLFLKVKSAFYQLKDQLDSF